MDVIGIVGCGGRGSSAVAVVIAIVRLEVVLLLIVVIVGAKAAGGVVCFVVHRSGYRDHLYIIAGHRFFLFYLSFLFSSLC